MWLTQFHKFFAIFIFLGNGQLKSEERKLGYLIMSRLFFVINVIC